MTRRAGDSRHRLTMSSTRIRGSNNALRDRIASSVRLSRPHKQVLSDKAVRYLEQEIRFVDMNMQELKQLYDLNSLVEVNGSADDDGDWEMLDGVLRGSTAMVLSHYGGELQEVLETLSQECEKIKRRKVDGRTRRDRTQRMVDAFSAQLASMTSAYMTWSRLNEGNMATLRFPEYQEAEQTLEHEITVLDLFYYQNFVLQLANDQTITSSLVLHGFIPCAPLKPQTCVSIRTLEVFRLTRMRCPHLGVQAFVKGLCDLHRMPYRSALSEQVTIAYDVYNSLLQHVETKVLIALDRSGPDWRLKNACPPCTYELAGEPELEHRLLFSMDGNNSLKRVLRRELGVPEDDSAGSSERTDSRWGGSDYFMPRDEVDDWSKHALEDMLAAETDISPCSDRWQNMRNDMAAAMWGVFDEAGIFLSLCRHSYVLLVADMIKSGELAKYPLSMTNRLIQVFGKKLCGGYDVGCKFSITLRRSPLDALATHQQFCCMVGLFHGHGHNRLCQLHYLPLYRPALGLENFENCEPYFSRSNSLASTTRYASTFHRHQSIVGFMKHIDRFETSQNLSKFLCDNYRQALEILEDAPILAQTMTALGVNGVEDFPAWLTEEKSYLQGLTREPEEETWKIDYLEKLVMLKKAEDALAASQSIDTVIYQDPTAFGGRDRTRNIERERRQKEELVVKALEAVHACETTYSIEHRWLEGSSFWIEATALLQHRTYRRCLDTLEGLVVARLFELTKMNMSQTGYKQRRHIAKALQVRSQSIRTCLERYNLAAQALRKPGLSWEDVVEYSFLSDFDLLRESRQDIRSRPWATHAGRTAMDKFYKLEGARKEIQRLDIEIRRVITWMEDEERYLAHHVTRLANDDPDLSFQIKLYCRDRTRFNHLHRQRFVQLSKQPGFTGNLQPGQRGQPSPGWHLPTSQQPSPSVSTTLQRTEDDEEVNDDDDDDEDGAAIAEAETVLTVIGD